MINCHRDDGNYAPVHISLLNFVLDVLLFIFVPEFVDDEVLGRI
jgi:hypothetical protein